MEKIINNSLSFVIGSLQDNPTGRQVDSRYMSKFKLAVKRTNRKGETKFDKYQITFWETNAHNCVDYLKKGDVVFVAGKQQHNTWNGENAPCNSIELNGIYINFGDVGTLDEEFDKFVYWRCNNA